MITMEQSNGYTERRRDPRLVMDLPLEYKVVNTSRVYAGVAMNGNQTGLLIRSIKDMPIGERLDINVLFPRRFRLAHFEASAKIVWKDLHLEENWEGYKYGLKFVHIGKTGHSKLKPLLSVSDEEKQ